MALEHAVRFPVLTIGSGPANSLRGAAYLTGRDDGIVVDVGGTSTDIGVLVGGFPRESSQAVEIGGVRTNFRMPDIVSIAVGGGTIVRDGAIGPDSVAWRIGDRGPGLRRLARRRSPTPRSSTAGPRASAASTPGAEHAELLRAGLALADVAVADAIDRVKTSRSDATIIAVGGGSVILDDPIPGASEILRPATPRRGQRHRRRHRQGQRQRRGGRDLRRLAATPRPCRPSPHAPAPRRWRPAPTPSASRSSMSRRHH